MDDLSIICFGGIVLLIIFGVIDSLNRASRAKEAGLVKCPKCRGSGQYDDRRCNFCRNSSVRGYVTPERKKSHERNQTIGCFVFLIIVVMLAYFFSS